MKKIAFLFLIYDTINNEEAWNTFFENICLLKMLITFLCVSGGIIYYYWCQHQKNKKLTINEVCPFF